MGETNYDSVGLTGNLEVDGNLTIGGTVSVPAGAVSRASLAQETGIFRQPLQLLRTIAGLVLDATGGAALHKIVAGAYGTGTLELRSNDANNNTITSTSSFEFVLPENYVSGGTITVRINGRSDGSGTITVRTVDVEAYKVAADGTAGSDICATTIQTMTGSAANYDFTVTPTGLVAGDKLRINFQTVLTITDATATRVIVSDVQVQCAVKG